MDSMPTMVLPPQAGTTTPQPPGGARPGTTVMPPRLDSGEPQGLAITNHGVPELNPSGAPDEACEVLDGPAA